MDGQDVSSVARFEVVLVLEPGVLLQLVQVEHVVKAVILVGDDVEHHVAVFLVSVHVMVHDHCSGVKLRLQLFACLSVDQVEQSLSEKRTFRQKYHTNQLETDWLLNFNSPLQFSS